MINVIGITKSYGNLKVLKGIDLHISEKEVLCIMGASGAGKTTLLQIIGTLLKPDSGEVIINNTSLFKLNDNKLAEFRNTQIGFVFQFHHLLPEFTAIENVYIPALIKGVAQDVAEKEAFEILSFLGLSERVHHKPDELSGGEQQRVAVARALINKPRLILADEPSGNLDSKNKKELHQLFFRLRDKYGQTFVIVTHDKELATMSDRTIQIADGMIIQS